MPVDYGPGRMLLLLSFDLAWVDVAVCQGFEKCLLQCVLRSRYINDGRYGHVYVCVAGHVLQWGWG